MENFYQNTPSQKKKHQQKQPSQLRQQPVQKIIVQVQVLKIVNNSSNKLHLLRHNSHQQLQMMVHLLEQI